MPQAAPKKPQEHKKLIRRQSFKCTACYMVTERAIWLAPDEMAVHMNRLAYRAPCPYCRGPLLPVKKEQDATRRA